MLAIAASQPIEEAPAVPVAIPVDEAAMEKAVESDDDAAVDMMPSESILHIIEKKVDHWLKKCYKHGGCGAGN